jgi:hypothetical protein
MHLQMDEHPEMETNHDWGGQVGRPRMIVPDENTPTDINPSFFSRQASLTEEIHPSPVCPSQSPNQRADPRLFSQLLLQFRGQRGEDFEKITRDSKSCQLKDRRIAVLVDRYNRLRRSHPGQVLNST